MTGRRNRGTMGTVIERFAAGLGTTNVVSYDPFDPAPIRKAMELVDRSLAAARRRLRKRELSAVVQREPVRNVPLACSPHLFIRPVPPGTPGHRGKFVQAEPRLSQTAACADEWLPIKPGTEGLLALAMAHVIVNEKLYDADFVNQSTNGFAAWSAALGDYAPEQDRRARSTCLPRQSSASRASLPRRRPSVAVGDSRDVASLTAIYALNALVGAYGRPGRNSLCGG